MLGRSPFIQVVCALALLWLGRLGIFVGLPIETTTSPAIFLGLFGLDLLILAVTIGFAIWLIRKHPRTLWFWCLSLSVGVVLISSANYWVSALADRAKNPPLPPQQSVVLETRGSVAYWSGPIDFDSFEALENTLQRYSQITSLSLSSGGGRIAAARGMARLVSEAKLDTSVSGTCSSACTLVFIAGENRSIGQDGQLGFHGYKLLSGIQTVDTDAEQTRDRQMFQERGVDALFLDRAFSIPFEEIWFPDHELLLRSGVTTN